MYLAPQMEGAAALIHLGEVDGVKNAMNQYSNWPEIPLGRIDRTVGGYQQAPVSIGGTMETPCSICSLLNPVFNVQFCIELTIYRLLIFTFRHYKRGSFDIAK